MVRTAALSVPDDKSESSSSRPDLPLDLRVILRLVLNAILRIGHNRVPSLRYIAGGSGMARRSPAACERGSRRRVDRTRQTSLASNRLRFACQGAFTGLA